jgi:hypothetical protein
LAALSAALGDPEVKPAEAASRLLSATLSTRRLPLVVDQYEALFTQSQPADVAPFQEALRRLIQVPRCYVVLTARADCYPQLMDGPLWPEIQARRYEMLGLDKRGVEEAIVQPAKAMQVFVETSLVERLKADVDGQPGVLPLLQETLVLLWDDLQWRLLPVSAYEGLGTDQRTRLQRAIAIRADDALSKLSETETAIARRIFLRLVLFGERGPTPRQQRVGELRNAADNAAGFDKVLEHLTKLRLLTLGGGEEDSEHTVDIAHEALISGWPTLQTWLANRREAEQARRRLEAKADEWVKHGRGTGYLLDEIALVGAERWLESGDAKDVGHSDELPAFVQVSRESIRASQARTPTGPKGERRCPPARGRCAETARR